MKVFGTAVVALMVVCGNAHAQITWVHREYSASMSWTGGDAMGSFTSGSASGVSDVGGTNCNYNGASFPQASNFFGDGLFMQPEGGQVSGGWNNQYVRNPAGPSGGMQPFPTMQYNTTSTSTRTFSVSGSGQFVFSISDASDFYRNTFSEQLAPFSVLMLEAGTFSGGVFTPTVGGLTINMLTTTQTPPGSPLQPGTYRFSMAYGATFEASESFGRSNEAAWGVYPVPAPATGALVSFGAMFASRRRRR